MASEQTAAGKPELLAISTYEKGQAFLREAARLGCRVTLLTTHKLWGADWPKEVLDHFETMPEELTAEAVLPHVTRLAKYRNYRAVVALDEFDLETAALVREHLRIPGMTRSLVRPFRDKLAMRETARKGGIPVPDFTSTAHHESLWHFLTHTQGPWLLKPRQSASAIGIHKFHEPAAVWPLLEQLGDEASHHLVECFVPGEIFHVEGLSWEGRLLWALPQKYGQPPFETMHDGGIFSTRTLDRGGDEGQNLLELHARTLQSLGMTSGPTHSEFIRAHADGKFYFLESAARVGGAYIAEVAEAASGINPWVEWARLTYSELQGQRYTAPDDLGLYGGSVICLARQPWPDLSAYTDPEIVHRLHKLHHAGVILRTNSAPEAERLVADCTQRFFRDFYTRMDAPAKPTS